MFSAHKIPVFIWVLVVICVSGIVSCSGEDSTPTAAPTLIPTFTSTPLPPTATEVVVETATAAPSPPTATIVSSPTIAVANTPTVSATSRRPTATATSLPQPAVNPSPLPNTSTPVPPAPIVTSSAVQDTATPVPTATSTTVPATATPPVEPVRGERGGVINLAVPQPAPNQDIHRSVSPILSGWGPGIAYSRLFRYRWISPDEGHMNLQPFETRYDPSSSVSAYEIQCDLCESWSFEDDFTLRITLKSNIRWQYVAPLNGRDFTSSDVVYSFERLSNRSFPNSKLLNTVSEVIAEDDRTVLIRMALPDAEILEKLADARAAVVAPEAVEIQGDLIRGPTVGTGPWILDDFSSFSMVFIANPDYHIRELPLADGLRVSVIPDEQTRVISLRTGQLDMVESSTGRLMEAVQRFPDLRWRSVHDAAAGVEVAMNSNRVPFSDISVRRAVVKAWDPYGLIDDVHHGQSFVGAGLPLADPDWLLPQSELLEYFNDVEAARLLVLNSEDLAMTDGVVVTVGEYGDEYINTAVSLADTMVSIGIDARVERVPTRTFGDDVWIGGDYDVYVGAAPPQSSVTAMLFSVHHTEGPWRSTGYENADLDALIELQTIEFDAARRREYLLDIQRLIFDGAHRFNAAAQVSHWVWWSHLHNVAPNSNRADGFWLTRLWFTDRVK